MAFAENLRGQGSGLSTCQAEGGPHAPENPAPPPTVGFRVIIDGLVQIPEVTFSLVVGKEIQQAKEFPMNAPRRGDNRREESATHILCRVYGPIFVNLLLILDLDGGDAGGDIAVSITHDGHEAILEEIVGPGLIAVNTCVDMMCVSTMRATTRALPIVGDESQHGRQRYPQE